jgi:hypothetical protein
MKTPTRRIPFPGTFALLLAVAAAPSARAAEPAAPAAPKAAAAEPIYDTYASGPKALEAGAVVALEKKRRLLVNFGTNDCAPCSTFSRAIYETRAFEETFKEQFVPVWIDVPVGSETEKLLKGYGIDRSRGLPAVAVLDVETKKAEVFREGEAAEAARKGPEEVRAFLLKLYRPTSSR